MSQIKGLNSLMKKLDRLGGDSHKSLKVGIKQANKMVQGEAKGLAPTGDSGLLKNSIKEKVEEKTGIITGKVSTNLHYAPYVEFGTGQRGEGSPSPPKSPENLNYRQDWAGMDAQPFLYPALKNNKGKVLDTVKEQLKKDIQKMGGS
ncbi:HK97 gp10 family phage protein [Sporosarcina sp. resist]|uniref:HK97-gp10 family putative phage morphogenesis protein n=1 Tax=Sporosarcina sp. resist TaxID=2762563 RepID=UPI00164E3FAC|nr:HK97-gp10 family putative phage morphogenesis protein [Sporosarcina sp. resist]QNK86430.1 HK97 gp10 family phage protein [Sporosarcina sp. resist]